MNKELIDTFLAIVETKNIASAAKFLYITQGSASNRIKLLESEFNVKLIERKKGIRNITLTRYGEEFIQIAQNFQKLYEHAQNLKNNKLAKIINIGAIDIFNSYLLTSFYKNYLSNNIFLNIKTYHSSEIFKKISENKFDIGITIKKYNYENINFIETIEDEFVIVKDKSNDILNANKEIYLPYSREYEIWHNENYKNKPLISVGTTLMQFNLLSFDKWAIVPEIAAKKFVSNNRKYEIIKIKNTFKRNIYIISSKNKIIDNYTNEFIKNLIKYIMAL